MNTKRWWQLGNILSVIFALVANFVVGAQLLSLPSISEISDKYATYLTPAGYAFSIWSLIYVLLVVLAVYQARDLFKPRRDNTLPQQMGPWFIIANVCNGLWTYIFVNDLVALSVAVLVVLTVSLFVLLWKLKIALKNPPLSVIACVWWPLMIYTGWVTVASVVNIASWLASMGVSVTPELASVVLVSLGVALLTLLIYRNLREVLLACIWGIVAIGVNQVMIDGNGSVAITAFTISGMLLVAVVGHALMNRNNNSLLQK